MLVGCGRDNNVATDSSRMDIQKMMRCSQQIEVTERYSKSLRVRINAIPVLVLRGNYEEMGEAHGVLAGKEIIQFLDNILIPYANKQHPNSWDRKVLPAAGAYVFSANYEKELTAMMRGIRSPGGC